MKYWYLLGFIGGLSACQAPEHLVQVHQPSQLEQKKQLSPITVIQQDIPASYQHWAAQVEHQQQIGAYKRFLKQHGTAFNVPDFQFFQTARDWQKCNYAEYEIPPRELWSNIVPTLNILNQLVQQKLIDHFTVTSVYRNPVLNQCAGGAAVSKHVFNAALDFRIGSENPDAIEQIKIEENKARLCQFWRDYGEALNMGLGVYASGQIHIDTAGYRTWGIDHRYSSSPCLKNFS
ncbi:D-Ala-D-Ala carboxypeptidase family metallohydrolase [Acinetobacter sp. C32I]|uniref:D-Ala-D-Ala carboxypeptidase family metallohydrolase n=1 Tax=Acinetobacter sp. C32I TaxID=2950074 RepID=UPI002036C149|nr:D-Ala-D-Ala carboxypeptidase family metallohydrolase [Acinetobacter sp. C32I]USA54454.1 D-Ala-D-Ala carboxypeptidase family metallohydrolase [Acinetobacter sp. C32I]